MTAEARSIRGPAASFKVRRRSLSPKRQAEFDTWIETWGLDVDGPPLDWAEVFGRTDDVVLDVGFGHGESTIAMAALRGYKTHVPDISSTHPVARISKPLVSLSLTLPKSHSATCHPAQS